MLRLDSAQKLKPGRSAKRQAGQSLPEYTLILALIALVCIAGLTNLGRTTENFLMNFSGQFSSITGG